MTDDPESPKPPTTVLGDALRRLAAAPDERKRDTKPTTKLGVALARLAAIAPDECKRHSDIFHVWYELADGDDWPWGTEENHHNAPGIILNAVIAFMAARQWQWELHAYVHRTPRPHPLYVAEVWRGDTSHIRESVAPEVAILNAYTDAVEAEGKAAA